MQFDLCMWTFNGAKTLGAVLRRINKVVPVNVVGQRLIVDDGSLDNTVSIAKACGWTVIKNEGKGISDGANTALKHVETEWFASFEQDLLLNPNWYNQIKQYIGDCNVGAVSGVRFASKPVGLIALQKYVARKYLGEKYLSSWIKSREFSSFSFGKTLDNTVYNTKSLLSVGGFPKLKTNAGVDILLAYKFRQAGFSWVVDFGVQSVHLRSGLRDELRHQYSYGLQLQDIWRNIDVMTGFRPPINRFGVVSRLLYSPLTGVFVAVKTGVPSVAFVHPLVRFYYAWGLLKSG